MAWDFLLRLSWVLLMSPVRELALSPMTSRMPGEALRLICSCSWVFFLESGPSHVSGASHAGYRFRKHGFRHVAAHVRRPPIEFSRRRGTHSTRVRPGPPVPFFNQSPTSR